MNKRPITRTPLSTASGYPSLQEHLTTRRRFLGVAGATLGTSSLLAACGRGLGQVDPDGGSQTDSRTPDASEPDADIHTMGEMPYPDYFTLRIPETGDLSAYLVDGGYCQFWVQVATYDADSYNALRDNRSDAQDRCRIAISDFTYDQLNTGQGVTAAEDDLTDAMDQLCQELNHHNNLTIEAVTLEITYLEAESHMDGGAPEPAYP